MTRTLTNTHRLGHQPGRAPVNGASGQVWQGLLADHRGDRVGLCAAANWSTSWTYVARQANSTGASPAFDGIVAVPTMWTKWPARHLAPRST